MHLYHQNEKKGENAYLQTYALLSQHRHIRPRKHVEERGPTKLCKINVDTPTSDCINCEHLVSANTS